MGVGWNTIDDETIGHANAQHVWGQSSQEAVIETRSEAEASTDPIERQAGYQYGADLPVCHRRRIGNWLGIAESVLLPGCSTIVDGEDAPRFRCASQRQTTLRCVIEQRANIGLVGHGVEYDDPAVKATSVEEPAKTCAQASVIDRKSAPIRLRAAPQLGLSIGR